MKRYLKNGSFLFGLIILSVLLLVLLISLFYIPYDTSAIEISNKLAVPSSSHLLGTDQFGRDILSRVMKGLQTSFSIGLLVVVIGLFFGILLGSFSGYYKGLLDEVVMKVIDAQMAFPGILVAMMLIAVFGNGVGNTVIALAVMSIPRFTRITRSGFIKYREAEFVKAERVRGNGNLRIMFFHILPLLRAELVATASLSFASAVMSESGLSYLGLGVQPPTPSLGTMLSEAQDYIFIAPWYIFIPAIVITLMVMGFNLVGDGIQEVSA